MKSSILDVWEGFNTPQQQNEFYVIYEPGDYITYEPGDGLKSYIRYFIRYFGAPIVSNFEQSNLKNKEGHGIS